MTRAEIYIHTQRNSFGFHDAFLKIVRAGTVRHFQVVWDATSRKAAHDEAKSLLLAGVYGEEEEVAK